MHQTNSMAGCMHWWATNWVELSWVEQTNNGASSMNAICLLIFHISIGFTLPKKPTNTLCVILWFLYVRVFSCIVFFIHFCLLKTNTQMNNIKAQNTSNSLKRTTAHLNDEQMCVCARAHFLGAFNQIVCKTSIKTTTNPRLWEINKILL